jgi:hypothetical protein
VVAVSDAYSALLAGKAMVDPATGITNPPDLHPMLFPFQSDITRWALRRGRAAIFADCGMGKTFMQLEWARVVTEHTGKPVLILAPLAVSRQTIREGAKLGLTVTHANSQDDVTCGIVITNYERMDRFTPSAFGGIVLDESSILKSFTGATSSALIANWQQTAFRLACTATPAPNDYMELGTHAEFVGAMSRPEMLASFFVHDGGETQKWRLRGHANTDFWRWLCSWAVMIRTPSDLGYSDEGFVLPPYHLHQHTVEGVAPEGELFAIEAQTLGERLAARRESIDERAAQCAALVNDSTEPWIVWCNLNAEADALRRLIPGAVEVRGSDDPETKEKNLNGFSAGAYRVLISKPSIAGFGMNWQHCPNVAFVGLSDSWEAYYQAVRRCWRFGQTRPVHVHMIAADTEGAVVANIKRKDADAAALAQQMVEHMHELNAESVRGAARRQDDYTRETKSADGWTLHLGDCVDVLREMPSESVHFCVFSPPFASLYTYSASDRDMGNCRDADEFYEHFRFAVVELLRVLKPGRLVSFHCMNLPTSKVRDGVIGLRDFRGELIRMFEEAGFIYHSEVVIWKDPVTAMQRTKALGLLHKTIRNDSSMSRQGIPDYLVTMRKPGDNPEPISHTAAEFPVTLWQRYASPVWMDINPSDTLEFRTVREDDDERHIAPLQLEVIRRAVQLWSAPGDLVLSPFAGIGSEGWVSIQEGRRFVGVELKRAYWERAARNLAAAHAHTEQDLFSTADAP